MSRYQYLCVIFLTALCCLLARVAEANDARALHDQAHAMGGALAQFGSYGIWKAIMRPEHRGTALLFGVLTSAMVCVTKEASDWGNGGNFGGRDLAYCGVGVGAAAIAIPLFGF